ncbi:hypothetical protein B0H14DRAFT_2572061 [Mycena olivaceomarginata]|nr:hypothetical protein B0H14DRAFT_2572061 [Mycena olivaceomarginata]
MPKEIAPSKDLPDVRFRVLIAGRANAGKTSILQRVCDTTESPKTYKVTGDGWGRETRRSPVNCVSQRGEHDISDELEFSNHKGYVFHDSRGLESGGVGELEKIQSFVRERSQRKRLQDRLHAIWYCIPMDDNRPKLNIDPLRDICKDKNIHVPVIAVFTKFEAFRHDIRLDLEDSNDRENVDLEDECKRRFEAEYLSQLHGGPKFVRLEGMDKPNARCDELIETTMRALDPATVMLMLLAVQTENLELNVKSLVPW